MLKLPFSLLFVKLKLKYRGMNELQVGVQQVPRMGTKIKQEEARVGPDALIF